MRTWASEAWCIAFSISSILSWCSVTLSWCPCTKVSLSPNTRRWSCADSILAHRYLRWTNIKSAQLCRLLFSGLPAMLYIACRPQPVYPSKHESNACLMLAHSCWPNKVQHWVNVSYLLGSQKKCIYITFIQRQPNVFDVGLTFNKCHTNVLCLAGCQLTSSASCNVNPSYHETFTQCYFKSGPALQTVAQHTDTIKFSPAVCWECCTLGPVIRQRTRADQRLSGVCLSYLVVNPRSLVIGLWPTSRGSTRDSLTAHLSFGKSPFTVRSCRLYAAGRTQDKRPPLTV